MKVVILAGGYGTRISVETSTKPKPMVEVSEKPLLWHIMKYYSYFHLNEFVIALGYKGEIIKDYFINYYYRANNFSISLPSGKIDVHSNNEASENWNIHLLDTGLNTQTGGRIKRISPFIGNETFMLTYGDGVSNIDLSALLSFHQSHGRIATVTAVRPPARFGSINFQGNEVTAFEEKPQTGEGWINGGFYIFEPEVKDYIQGDDTVFEREPMENLAKDGQLMAYPHDGFWQCMDTLRDLRLLEELWKTDKAPWKVW